MARPKHVGDVAIPSEEITVVLVLRGAAFLVGPAVDMYLLDALFENTEISSVVLELVTAGVVYRAPNV